MLYDMDLLCKRRQGKFATIWIAATRGIKVLSSKEIESVNTIYICEQIMNYVMSNSLSPSKRISLHLSANLIYGTVLVHRAQIKKFERQLFFYRLEIKVSIPTISSDNDIGGEPPKKKRRIRKQIAPAPDAAPGEIDEQTLNELQEPLPPFDLTELQELLVPNVAGFPPEDLELPFQIPVEDPFGDEGQINLLVNVVDSDVYFPERRDIPELPSAEPVIQPEQEHVTEFVSAMSAISSSPILIRQRRLQLPEIQQPTIEQALQPDVPPVPTRRERGPGRIRQPRPSIDFNMMYFVISPKRRRTLKQDTVIIRKNVEKTVSISEVQKHLEQLFIGTGDDIVRQIDQQSSVSSISSGITNVSRVEEKPVETPQLPTFAEPGPSLMDIPEEQNQLTEISPEEQIIPEQDVLLSPCFSRISEDGDRRLTKNTDIAPNYARKHTSTPIPVQKTYDNLFELIRESFTNNGFQSLKIEEICKPIVNRLYITRTFCELLTLQKEGFVEMKSAPNSIELDIILPGERLQEY